MRTIKFLVVHCTATAQNATIKALQNGWKALGWSRPGYHYVVFPDGSYRALLDIELPSNGVAGFNANSIHVSYIGGVGPDGKPADTRTDAQKATLLRLLTENKKRFPAAKILGHRDFSPDKNGNGKVDYWERIKECPCFDAIPEYSKVK
jgi:N-acetylmuramoyl-L-alanine amidase